ncbi:hypothetical protein ON010_g2212 [Phytophthora cinnamomi]|nr:hypothetical protein ON010_g2212 [Phytophthora cinnamomi]
MVFTMLMAIQIKTSVDSATTRPRAGFRERNWSTANADQQFVTTSLLELTGISVEILEARGVALAVPAGRGQPGRGRPAHEVRAGGAKRRRGQRSQRTAHPGHCGGPPQRAALAHLRLHGQRRRLPDVQRHIPPHVRGQPTGLYVPVAPGLRRHHDPHRRVLLPHDLLFVLLPPVAAHGLPRVHLDHGRAHLHCGAHAGVQHAQVPRGTHVHLPGAGLLRRGPCDAPGVALRALRPSRDGYDRPAAAHGAALHERRHHLRHQVPGALLPRPLRPVVLEPPALARLRRGRRARALRQRAAAVRVALEHAVRSIARRRTERAALKPKIYSSRVHLTPLFEEV